MNRRIVIGGVVAVMLFTVAMCGIGVTMLFGVFTAKPAKASCGAPWTPSTGDDPEYELEEFEGWNSTQVGHAATIVAAGKKANVPPRGWVVALATAMQESTLRNLANDNPEWPEVERLSKAMPHDGVGRDHDSVGLFQQRADEGEAAKRGKKAWGPVRDLMTPAISATKFYQKLLRISGWQTMDLSAAAQAVQGSAFPDAYAKWETKARGLAAHVAGVAKIEDIGGGSPGAPCGDKSPNLGDIVISPGGWTKPVVAPVGGGFRTSDRPQHQGVDLSAQRHTPIVAASSGKVVRVVCNASTGNCDRDGGVNVKGCGWYVEVLHAGDIVTRYCHMVQRPEVNEGQDVQAGTLLGFVGSSGHSSGPHLHYEVHLVGPGGRANNDNATDPVAFMKKAGAPLGEE